jgi:hypothetical protein
MTRKALLPTVHVIGAGVSAFSAAVSLRRFGFAVRWSGTAPYEKNYPIALNGAAQFLIEHLWGTELLTGMPHHRLSQRVVIWGPGKNRVTQETAMVVDAAALSAAMQTIFAAHDEPSNSLDNSLTRKQIGGDSQPWTVDSTGQGCETARLSGGDRFATMVPVALSVQASPDALLIEATDYGWMALLPTGPSTGSLFAFSPPSVQHPDDMLNAWLDKSVAIRRWLDAITGPATTFPTAPTFRAPPHDDERCLYIGRAAMTMDPLSGEGAAATIRTGHLAASLIAAHSRGETGKQLRTFYSQRLAKAMSAHLDSLLSLYSEAPFCKAWHSELDAMKAMSAKICSSAVQYSPMDFTLSEGGLNA